MCTQLQHNGTQDERPHVYPIVRLHLTGLLHLVTEDRATAVYCVSTRLHRLGIKNFIECLSQRGGRNLQAWLQDLAGMV